MSENIRKLLEEINIPEDKIDELITNMDDVYEGKLSTAGEVDISGDIKTRLLYEKDWRKRASLAARLISDDLDK